MSVADRSLWEVMWPGYGRRYLAFCFNEGRVPEDFEGVAFICWLGRRSTEFRAARCPGRDFVPRELDEEYDRYLWEGSWNV